MSKLKQIHAIPHLNSSLERAEKGAQSLPNWLPELPNSIAVHLAETIGQVVIPSYPFLLTSPPK